MTELAIVTAWYRWQFDFGIGARPPAPAGNRGFAGRSGGSGAAAERMAAVPGWVRPAKAVRPSGHAPPGGAP